MNTIDRRSVLRMGLAFFSLPGLHVGTTTDDQAIVHTTHSNKRQPMKIHYLEIVTPDVEAACALYAGMYGVTFGEADPNLGGARTADLDNGGKLGVRGPLRDTEEPIVRPYVLVEDIKASVAAAGEAGAEIAMPPMEIPGYGQFAIVIQGGIDLGLWQL